MQKKEKDSTGYPMVRERLCRKSLVPFKAKNLIARDINTDFLGIFVMMACDFVWNKVRNSLGANTPPPPPPRKTGKSPVT